jgi:mannitol/fructose-specific phosphotransferase system IIA component
MSAALEIRLQSRASFQEKLLQLVGKSATKKGTSSAPFLRSWVQRTHSKF